VSPPVSERIFLVFCVWIVAGEVGVVLELPDKKLEVF
jgi:hypothetical protein